MARERQKSAKQLDVDAALAEKADAKREQEKRRKAPEKKGPRMAKTFDVGVRVSCAARELGPDHFDVLVERDGAEVANASREYGSVQGLCAKDVHKIDVLWDCDGTVMELPATLLRCGREPNPRKEMQSLAGSRLGPKKVAAKRAGAPNKVGSNKRKPRAGGGAKSAKEPLDPLGVAAEAHARDQVQLVLALSNQNRLLHAAPQAARASFGAAATYDS